MFSRRPRGMQFRPKRMQFKPTKSKRTSNRFAVFIVSFVIAIIVFLYTLNSRLMPVYLDYAEIQTYKIASHVVSKAISANTTNVLDINDVIEDLPSESEYNVTTRFNTEIINQMRAELVTLVKEHLKLAEQGDLSQLPDLENVEYDISEIEKGDGIVFFVPIAQALNLPLMGNLGPRVPIRFHIIGNAGSEVDTEFEEFGINMALVRVNVIINVNVQIIIPFASKQTNLEQTIPVAIGLVRGQVPHIYTNGGEGAQPSIEVPIPLDPKE